eukprot:jgi/Chrpa1/12046/Chrysochromulina_OHIO_Genome00012477-RA
MQHNEHYRRTLREYEILLAQAEADRHRLEAAELVLELLRLVQRQLFEALSRYLSGHGIEADAASLFGARQLVGARQLGGARQQHALGRKARWQLGQGDGKGAEGIARSHTQGDELLGIKGTAVLSAESLAESGGKEAAALRPRGRLARNDHDSRGRPRHLHPTPLQPDGRHGGAAHIQRAARRTGGARRVGPGVLSVQRRVDQARQPSSAGSSGDLGNVGRRAHTSQDGTLDVRFDLLVRDALEQNGGAQQQLARTSVSNSVVSSTQARGRMEPANTAWCSAAEAASSAETAAGTLASGLAEAASSAETDGGKLASLASLSKRATSNRSQPASSIMAVIPLTTVSFSAATPSVASSRLIFCRMAHTTRLAGSSRRLAITVSSFEWEEFWTRPERNLGGLRHETVLVLDVGANLGVIGLDLAFALLDLALYGTWMQARGQSAARDEDEGGAPSGASNADRWAGARPDYLVCGGGGGGDGGGDGGGGGATAAAALFGVGVVEGSPFFVLDAALGCLSYVYSVASRPHLANEPSLLFKRICLVDIEIEPSSRRLAHGPEAMSEGAVPSTALLCSVEGTCLLWNSDGPCDEATASATSSSRSVSETAEDAADSEVAISTLSPPKLPQSPGHSPDREGSRGNSARHSARALLGNQKPILGSPSPQKPILGSSRAKSSASQFQPSPKAQAQGEGGAARRGSLPAIHQVVSCATGAVLSANVSMGAFCSSLPRRERLESTLRRLRPLFGEGEESEVLDATLDGEHELDTTLTDTQPTPEPPAASPLHWTWPRGCSYARAAASSMSTGSRHGCCAQHGARGPMGALHAVPLATAVELREALERLLAAPDGEAIWLDFVAHRLLPQLCTALATALDEPLWGAPVSAAPATAPSGCLEVSDALGSWRRCQRRQLALLLSRLIRWSLPGREALRETLESVRARAGAPNTAPVEAGAPRRRSISRRPYVEWWPLPALQHEARRLVNAAGLGGGDGGP